MNLLWISEGPALDHRPERFKRCFVTRNRPPALQFLDIAAYLADILMQRATLMLMDTGFVADRRLEAPHLKSTSSLSFPSSSS